LYATSADTQAPDYYADADADVGYATPDAVTIATVHLSDYETQGRRPTSRLNIEYTFVSNGLVETRHGSHRAYSCRELTILLMASGFTVEFAEPWTRDAHAVSFIATKT